MPVLVRGDQRDQALLGIQTPINPWSQAYIGFWVPAEDDQLLPPPECWLPIAFPQDGTMQAIVGDSILQTTLLQESNISVRIEEASISVSLEDDFVKARVPC